MFADSRCFNESLASWDVSNVSRMDNMLRNAMSFNQPLETWNMHRVMDVSSMFAGAVCFNQPLERVQRDLHDVYISFRIVV